MDMPHIPTHPALQRYLVGKDDPLGRTGLIGELGVKASNPPTLELQKRMRHVCFGRRKHTVAETHRKCRVKLDRRSSIVDDSF